MYNCLGRHFDNDLTFSVNNSTSKNTTYTYSYTAPKSKHRNSCCSIVYNNQRLNKNQMFINRGLAK